jgi:ABC-type amino acid transport substrate-binding protein
VVAAKFGSPQQDFLTAKKYRFLSGVNGYDNMLKMLERGNIEAFALPEAALNTIVKDIAWQPKTEVLLKRDVGFYLPLKGDPTLAKILDEAVQKCRR